MVLVTGNGLFSQDKKESPGKVKGFLPPYYGKIGLEDEQKISIYKIQAKYKDEVKKLEDKISEIKTEERREMDKILTAEQKQKLIQAITGEKSKEVEKK